MRDDTPISIPFMKMHGLGNDFVIVDARTRPFMPSQAFVQRVGDRHMGVGFDQFVVISDGDAGVHLTFWNSDGTRSAACGNATRCIAHWLMAGSGKREVAIGTDRGQLSAKDVGNGMTAVNMGAPLLQWQEVPLSKAMDTNVLPIEGAPTATGMGNPHCTFFVDDVEAIELERFGPEHEHHPLFPERTNVQIVQKIGHNHLRMRVWERGAGITLASGSSSCAVAVAAARRGLTDRAVTIDLDGGTLNVDWRDDGVWMTGPTAHVFDGTFTGDFIRSVS